MALFRSPFSRFSHKSTPVVATNMSLDSWCHQSHDQSTRLVRKVEMCTALSAGEDARGTPLDKYHHHTLLRVSLAPSRSGPGPSADTLLIERVLSTGGAYHSVTPIGEALSTSSALLYPDVHDRICIIVDGSSTTLAHHLEVERTLAFSNRTSEPHITLTQLAQILAFVSRTTKLMCEGGDCRFQSRSFVFTCLVALAPSLPPRKIGEGLGTRVGCGADVVDDSVYELSAEAFLVQVPWLVRDPVSMQAVGILLVADMSDADAILQLELIEVLKDGPREGARARLYH